MTQIFVSQNHSVLQNYSFFIQATQAKLIFFFFFSCKTQTILNYFDILSCIFKLIKYKGDGKNILFPSLSS